MKRKPKRQTKRQRKRIEKARSVIDSYVEHAAEVFPRHFTKDCCINATRVLVEVMVHFGVSAQPLSVSCMAHNKILVDCIEKHHGSMTDAEIDEAYDNGAWGVRIETGKQIKPGGWAGHLVAVVGGEWLVDSSAGQMSRPHKGIELPPIIVAPATRRFQSGDELCGLSGPEGALLLYEAKPGDTSYATARGWQRHDGNRRVAAEIIEAMEKPKVMITISKIEKALGSPAGDWAGRCAEVAAAAAPLIEGATAVYGHYLGPIAPGTLFSGRPGFVQHGWVELDDGRVLDPTRWAFEGAEPYLYVGVSDHYDEGGNQLRRELQGEAPMFDTERVVNIAPHILSTAAWKWMEEILSLQEHVADDGYEPGDMGFMQLVWIANLDPRTMGLDGEHAVDIYTMLDKLNQSALIPLDNQLMVEKGRHRRSKP